VYFAVLLINLISADVILYLSCSPIAQVSQQINKVGNAKVLYIFNPVRFWNSGGFKFLLINPSIWRNLDILTVKSF
jgi:hypothetical protein